MDVDSMSHEAQILRDLIAGKRITPLDALRDYQCFRLGARVYDLRKKGHDIKTEEKYLARGKVVAEYWM